MRVHDSQAYRKMDVTRERISRILELLIQVVLLGQEGSFLNLFPVKEFVLSVPFLFKSSVKDRLSRPEMFTLRSLLNMIMH